MRQAILEMSSKGFGCVAITGEGGELIGIITDGDIRRHIASDLLSMTVDQVMTREPKTLGPETLVAKALQTINSSAITALMVVENRVPVGLVHLHDLLRIGAA
jgi:arabinose-5-phosphate isomerase